MDELEQRVRRALQHPAASADATEVLGQVHRGARRRRQRRRIALAAASVVAVAGVGTAAGIAGAGTDRAVDPAKSFTTPPNPSETSATERPGSRVELGTVGFDATGPDELWRVSAAWCDELLCAQVLRTDGNGWQKLLDVEFGSAAEADRYDEPPVHLVRVADNRRDAWAYGRQMWVTHDGGDTWAREDLPGTSHAAGIHVRPLGDDVFALQDTGGPVRLWRARIGGGGWAEAPLPSGLQYAEWMDTVGDTLVVVGYLDDRRALLLSDDAGETWREGDVPCQGEADVPRSTGRVLLAPCPAEPGRFRGAQAVVWRSADGVTWQPLAGVRHSSYLDGVYPVQDDTVFAVTGDGGLLVSPDGQQEVPLDLGRDGTALSGEFTTPDRGYLLTASPRRLLATADGGRTWTQYD